MKYDVTILFPCLNEENTIDKCIKDVKKIMDKTKYKYEILISDNGSTDSSIKIAKKNKVNTCIINDKGYGNALINGIKNAKGTNIVMLDCDCSYNTNDIPKFIKELEENDLVVGNRFNNNTKKEATNFIHKLGAKLLTKYSNILFHTKLKDYHCGLRAFKKDKILSLDLNSGGMEFASEMIIKAKINKLKIKEINTIYLKDQRVGKSHLKPLKDGYRHLKLINKLKFNNSIFYRYIKTYIITLLILICSLLLISCIPQKSIYKNTINSFKYYYDNEKVGYLNNNTLQKDYYRIDYKADMKSLSMSYYIDENNKMSSLIKMNYLYNTEHKLQDFSTFIKNDDGNIVNYARYWQGQTIFIRPLLVFFNIRTIYFIGIFIYFILFLYLFIKLFKKDKLLGISYLIGHIIINFFIIPYCFEYIFAFLLAYIISILILKMYDNNSKNLDILFLISGITTCFFDFLTCETITLTLPLFIYSYLKIKNKNITYKEIIKYIILWGIGYSTMFFLKWLIGYIYYGNSFIKDTIFHANKRIYSKNYSYISLLKYDFIALIKCLFPFNIFKYGISLFVCISMYIIYNFIFNEKNKKAVFKLIIIILIPVIRYLILISHTYNHFYFVYRALLPVLMFYVIYIVYILSSRHQ